MNRLCIYPKDIQRITGKSERQSRNILAQIKAIHNKKKHQLVTFLEFCEYLDINPEDAKDYIK